MKILLLGEFSGVHKNLKEGLLEIGHDAVVASHGDGWKKITSDIDLNSKHSGFAGKIERKLKPFLLLKKSYDVLQIINPIIISPKYGMNSILLGNLIKRNNKNFLLGTGCDVATSNYFKGKHAYPQICQACKTIDMKAKSCRFESERETKFENGLLDEVNGVIPLIYEYAQAYRDIGYKKLLPTIKIPININKIKYMDNVVRNKLVVFHGLNREGFKGTHIIKQAMENVKDRYPNDIDIVIEGRIPFERYFEVIMKTNVVIDQSYTISYGFNAVYSMALGKVVMGGGKEKCLKEFKIKKSPIIAIDPTVEDIEKKIVDLLDRKNEIKTLGYESRAFVEENHDYIKISRIFVDAWRNG